MGEKEVEFSFYRYDPSMAAAVIFIIAFIIVTAIHTYQMIRTRLWILIPFVLGGFCKFALSFRTSRISPTNYITRYLVQWIGYIGVSATTA